MGFGCLRHIPKWSMNQDLIVALARSYNKERMHLEVKTGDIPVNARVISHALGLPANGDSFPKLDTKKHCHLIETFEGRTQKEVKTHVIRCSVTIEVKKEEFRRYFIMFVMKAFLFASKGLRKYKEDGIRTIDGCMFALLILYLHTNKHGDLREYSGGVEPWTKEWTVAELREVVKEEQVRELGNVDEPQKRTHDKRQGAQVRPRTKERTRKRPKKIVADLDLQEVFDASIEKHELQEEVVADCGAPSPVSNKKHHAVIASIENHELQEEVVADCEAPSPVSNEEHHVVNESSVKECRTSKCLDMVVYSGLHESVNDMESSEVDHGIPQDDAEECNRLFSKPTSVNNTPPTPAPVIIPPDFDEDAKEKVYRWVIDDRNPLDEVIVWYWTHYTLDLTRRDLKTLRRREWVDGRVIECMCALFNELPAKRFQEEFYCINPMILIRVMTPMNVEKFKDKHNSEYVGLAECWGNEIRLFNKVEAAKRHTAKLIDELAQLTFSWYKVQDEGIGKPLYVDVPIQPNNYDCGIFVIKFMDSWDPETLDMDDYVVPVWTTYLLDIMLDPWNGYLNTVEAVAHVPLRRAPQRNKRKELRDPWTAPNTAELTRRTEEAACRRANRRKRKT
ncbi:uncharacterized protein DS421_16g556580 [Arachis hypogaea]|nr:uncharacterized protein DS421_16g556580 [Arachis hypogaea]